MSLCFSLSLQLLLVLPVYFLAPLATFVLLGASAAYLVVTGQWTLLAVVAWWLITTPYWSIIHFVTFPVLFPLSLAFQLFLSIAAFIATSLYPTLPADALRYYHERTSQAASASHQQQHAVTPGYEPETKPEALSPVFEYPRKEEESKSRK